MGSIVSPHASNFDMSQLYHLLQIRSFSSAQGGGYPNYLSSGRLREALPEDPASIVFVVGLAAVLEGPEGFPEACPEACFVVALSTSYRFTHTWRRLAGAKSGWVPELTKRNVPCQSESKTWLNIVSVSASFVNGFLYVIRHCSTNKEARRSVHAYALHQNSTR